MLPRKDRQVFNLVTAGGAAVCAVVADQRAIAQEKKVGVGIEKGGAAVATKTVEMPSIASYYRSLANRTRLRRARLT